MERAENLVPENSISQPGDRQQIEIVFYTDPLCCWSWAFEPQWRKLQYEFEGQLRIRNCMGGLLADWNSFHDTVNCVTRPVQMGPVWMQAAYISGMPIYNRVWIDDPPASSYLACIAVKAAGLQSDKAGAGYLRALREAIMLRGINIARQTALLTVAENLSDQQPGLLNIPQFKNDIVQQEAKNAFRWDLEEIRLKNITRLPALLFRCPGKQPLITVGCRTYAELLQILQQISPGIARSRQAHTPEMYSHYWKSITPRELEEGCRKEGDVHFQKCDLNELER